MCKDVYHRQAGCRGEARPTIVDQDVGRDVFCSDLVYAARAVAGVGEDVELLLLPTPSSLFVVSFLF